MRRAIFIGYRRADTGEAVGRVYDALCHAFGEREIFRDVDNMPIGSDFRVHIAKILPKCRVFLAFIGPDWLEARDAQGRRRLDDPDDLVRVEIETALATPKLLFVPVLVNGARMPGEHELPAGIDALARRHAAIMRGDPDFRNDVARLADALREHVKTGRLNLQALGGASSVAANAAGVSMLLVAAFAVVGAAGVTAAVPELREPVWAAASQLRDVASSSAPNERSLDDTKNLGAEGSNTAPAISPTIQAATPPLVARTEAANLPSSSTQRESNLRRVRAELDRIPARCWIDWTSPCRQIVLNFQSEEELVDAADGDPRANYVLGSIAVSESNEQWQRFLLAARGGVGQAQYEICRRGYGVDEDERDSMCHAAGAQGNSEAAYLAGIRASLSGDRLEACRWFRVGAGLGHQRAQEELADDAAQSSANPFYREHYSLCTQ